MKHFFIGAFALLVLGSCNKDEQTGIPPIDGVETPTITTEVVNASEIDNAYYQANKNKKVTIKGLITIQNTRAYFKLKDNTLIQIYASKNVFDALSDDTKNKLAINGQEVTVTGTFTDYTDKSGNLIKEIVYTKEGDLVFGATSVETIAELEASKATLADYAHNKKVKLHGNIVAEGTKSYFKLSDNTMILIFAHKSVFDVLSAETKTKLATTGQEVTVTGTFTDYTDKSSGNLTREILYTKESDLVFGKTPEAPSVVEIDATTTNLNDVYAEDKAVKVSGKITIISTRSWITFKDGEKAQLYIAGFSSLPQETKDKLNTEGQEVVVTGTFKTYSGTKQIQVKSGNDITFKTSGTKPTTTEGKFDFENTATKSTSYTNTETLTNGDVSLTYKARTDVDTYGIEGKGLMLRNSEYIKITFSSGVKQVKFAYKGAFTNKDKRKVIVYEGDENSTQDSSKLKEQEFAFDATGEVSLDLNKTGSYTITIKGGTTRQIVIDNITWTK